MEILIEFTYIFLRNKLKCYLRQDARKREYLLHDQLIDVVHADVVGKLGSVYFAHKIFTVNLVFVCSFHTVVDFFFEH